MYMSRTISHIILLLTIASSFVSCNIGDNNGKRKSAAVSSPYELLVVAPKDWLSTADGEPLLDIINAEIPALNQPEQNFRTTTINPVSFKGTFIGYSNVIKVDINRKYTKAEMQIARDVYCQPQIIVQLVAPTQESFAQLCTESKQRILRIFNDAELERATQRLKKNHSGIVAKAAKDMFQCTVYAPQEINAILKGKDFFWASSEGQHENYLNFCMYSYPFTSNQTFTIDYFANKRDSVMKINITGEEHDGLTPYMMTYKPTLVTTDLNLNNNYVQEVRGLWAMEHDAMGGPFISYVQVDTTRNRVIVAEGFVYRPNKPKRELIRSLEAALRTLKVK